ncbi:MAG: NAD(P)-binding domain-containing protein [Candidatus Marsarchaeota archaeon]|nr:NAD(P)-binding domain-containing protein [Candidatus Marsarchaeota archaeon]
MKVAIIGTGKVGKNIGTALIGKYEVVYGSRDPAGAAVPKGAEVKNNTEAVKDADVVFMAVPYSAVKQVVESIGAENLSNKTVVDVTNALDSNMQWVTGFNTSAAEELAKMIPKARIVKAFNTVFAQHMGVGKLNGEKLALFIAGDNDEAKSYVREIGESIGFDVVDAGELKSARYLEALGMLNIELGFSQKLGTAIGFRLVR